jgi:hypothetical protein
MESKGSKGSGKLTVISLLLIIGLSIVGVVTALTGEKKTAMVDSGIKAESKQPAKQLPAADQ